jgi:hypothetical protein
MADKPVTERQQLLIDHLLGAAKGDVRTAMTMAGYSEYTTTHEALNPIADEIIKQTQMYIATNAPKAAIGMVGVITDPSMLGAKNVIAASKELLDRAGLVKKEKIEITAPEGAMFILPPKQES